MSIIVSGRVGGTLTQMTIKQLPQATATQFRAAVAARYYMSQPRFLQALLDLHTELLRQAREGQGEQAKWALDLLERCSIGPVDY